MKVSGLTINREAGTERSYYAIWKFSGNNLDHFTVIWKYSTGQTRKVEKTTFVDPTSPGSVDTETIWFTGSTESVTIKSATLNYTSRYTPPDNAVAIQASVKPVPEKITYETTDSKGNTVKKQKYPWTGEYVSKKKTLPEETITVEAPSTPSLSANKYKLTAVVSDIAAATNIKEVQFQLYRGNELRSTVKKAVSALRTATATWEVKVPGSGFKVRARGVNGKYYSSWTGLSSVVGTIPETPTVIKTITKNSTTEMFVDWDNCTAATSYILEYTTQKGYFDSNPSMVTSQEVNESAAQVSGLTPGTVYYFRVCAKNSVGETAWSAIKDSNTDMDSGEVSVPDTPTVTINSKNVLTVTTENLADDIDKVTFVVKKLQRNKKTGNDEWVTDKTITNVVPSALRVATAKYTITSRTTYKACAKGFNVYKTAAGKTVSKGGAWSHYSEQAYTIPEQPVQKGTAPNYDDKKKSPFKLVKAQSETEAVVYWHPMTAATLYDLEYTTDVRYFDFNPSAVTQLLDRPGYHVVVSGLDSGNIYYFRMRAKNDAGTTAWSCVYDYTKGYVSVKLGTIPAAPTTWSSTTTAIVGERVFLYWLHNCEDGSADRQAKIELTENGVTRTITITNAENNDNNPDNDEVVTRRYVLETSSYTEGTIVEWRVCTKGILDTWGEWSVSRQITVNARPTLSLLLTDDNDQDLNTGETATVTAFPFYLTAEAGPQSQTPISYHVSVVADEAYQTTDRVGNLVTISPGDEVYSQAFDISDDLTLEFSAHNIDLEDGIPYTIKCIVSMNSGLTASEDLPFTVDWTDVFYELDAEIVIDDSDYSASIKPVCLDEDGVELEDGYTLAVYRREFDGRFTEIQPGIVCGQDTFVTDPHPSLDFARYRIVATDDSTGAISYTDLPGYPVAATVAVMQWDEVWSDFNAGEDIDEELEDHPRTGSLIKLPYNVDVSDSNAPDVALVNYIGRQHPVSYYGTQLGTTATWKVEIPKADTDTLYALRRLSIWMGDVYVREPSGSGYWAHVTVSFNQTHCDLTIPVTFTVTRVEGGI